MAKDKTFEKKLIDVEGLMKGEKQLKDISYNDLLADAVARKDKEAILYLKEQQALIDERKMKDGKIVKTRHPISVIRSDYLKKYYKTTYKTKNTLSSEQKTINNRNKLIEEQNNLADFALSMIEE